MTLLAYSRNIPIRYECDILVAGGGPSGVAAAVVAAREGKSVCMVEAHSCLGGQGTAGMVPAFMQFTDGENFLSGGFGEELLDTLEKQGGTFGKRGRSIGIRAEVLKRVYDTFLQEVGVSFVFHTQVIDAIVADECITEVVCAGKTGLFALRANVFVDGTGDGDLAVYAGAAYEKGDQNGNMMPGTLCSLWGGIDWDAVKAGGLGTGNKRIEEAFKDGVFSLEDWHLPGMWRVGETIGGGNIGHTFRVDGTDEASLTKAYVWGRKSLLEYERYYKEYLKGFENMELVATGLLMGIRETRRIMGDYVLNIDDFTSRAVFDDEIGRYSYPVDIHVARPDRESYDTFHKEITTMRLGRGESYGIPYRTLTPKGLKNVLVAGRCVSTDRQVQASIRVMPGCYITGQAAGMAAVLMLEHNTDSRGIDVKVLQKRLKKIGAFLPNVN